MEDVFFVAQSSFFFTTSSWQSKGPDPPQGHVYPQEIAGPNSRPYQREPMVNINSPSIRPYFYPPPGNKALLILIRGLLRDVDG